LTVKKVSDDVRKLYRLSKIAPSTSKAACKSSVIRKMALKMKKAKSNE